MYDFEVYGLEGVKEGRKSRVRKRGVYEKSERKRVTCSSRDTDKHPYYVILVL